MSYPCNIAFVGGGTGGHITPIVSLIRFLEDSNIRAKCNRIYWFGEKKGLEERYANEIDQVVFIPVKAGKRRRYWSLQALTQNMKDFVNILDGFFTSLRYLRKHNISVVFCKGGYVALPVCLAAWILQIDILVHESDSVPGITNRIVSKLATLKFGGFPKNLGRETIHTGQILSPELLGYKKAGSSLDLDSLDTTKTVVLVMGGSQGASALFDTLLTILNQNETDNMHFLVLLGTKNKDYQADFSRYSTVTTFTYLPSSSIGYLYAISDVAITRGGATSLAEQQLFGIKKIIIPTPFTGGNHQLYNAQRYKEQAGDQIIVQSPHLRYDLVNALDEYIGFKKEAKEPDTEHIFEAHKKIFGTLEILFDQAKENA